MSYEESTCDCEQCSSEIVDGEKVVCMDCFADMDNEKTSFEEDYIKEEERANGLDQENEDLGIKITELEKEIETLKDEIRELNKEKGSTT